MTRTSEDGSGPSAVARFVVPVWCAAMTLAVVAPVLAPGYVLSYDMVFTPRQYLVPDALGVGTAPPRAVPVDAVVAVVTAVVPGQVVQKAVLIAALFLAGLGAARLVPSPTVAQRLVAATLYTWNPYVAERLVIGHWSLLVAYAALPWLLRSALAARSGEPAVLARTVLLCAICALTPTGGLLAAAVVGVVFLLPGTAARARALGAAAVVVVNAPWWLPAVLQPSTQADVGGVEAFAARADTFLGDVGSLLSLGGIWNAQVVPGSRATVFAAVSAVGVLLVAALGLRTLWSRDRALALVLVVLGVGGLTVAALGTTSGGEAVLEAVIRHVPGAGLLRDGQKFVGLLAPLLSVGLAAGAGSLADWLRERAAPIGGAAVLAGAVLLPVVAMPDLALGAAGRLDPVSYPREWDDVRDALAEAPPTSGDLVVLPWAAFRRFGWNDRRTVLDPAPRYLPVPVVGSGDLRVGDRVVTGDDHRARTVETLLGSGRPLATTLPEEGIGWVLVERDASGRTVGPAQLSGARLVVDAPTLRLFRLPGPVADVRESDRTVVVGVDLAVFVVLAVCGAVAFRRRRVGALLS